MTIHLPFWCLWAIPILIALAGIPVAAYAGRGDGDYDLGAAFIGMLTLAGAVIASLVVAVVLLLLRPAAAPNPPTPTHPPATAAGPAWSTP